MTYDADGNTLNDGTNTYTWDTRNHLVSADNNGASFVYDGLGRRFGKTMLDANTNFVYDGLNPVQELSGTTPTANLLSGALDERFTRTDSTGTFSYLTDALGSTIALTDSTGNSDVQYSYDPYGSMSITGTTTNSYAYTGREFDGLGIDYYRARYYNPQTGRFLSEDPIGFRGGINEYAYVGDSPTNFIDPSGMDKKNIVQCASKFANKYSIAGGLHALGVPNSGFGGFVTDALGGNAISGVVDLGTSLLTGQSGEGDDAHSVFYNMGEGIVAGPTQGFSSVATLAGKSLDGTPWGSGPADVVTEALVGRAYNAVTGAGQTIQTLDGTASLASTGMDAAEFASGIGVAKLIYDAASFGVGLVNCSN